MARRASLRDKFRGCIGASWAGSAMGAAVEGSAPEDIRARHGFLREFLPYRHYTDLTNWRRVPGTTEDGIERQKLMATAIIEKGDRILAQDLVKIWLRDLTPRRMVFKQEAFDRSLLELARAGVPPAELGELWPYPNVVSVARASHPLGLINAGDPKGAADDTFEVGRVYARQTHFGLRWAALYNAAIAEACSPGATVSSIVRVALQYAGYRAQGALLYSGYDTIEQELERGLKLASEARDFVEIREGFARHYHGGDYFNYGMSQANEIVTKGLALFSFYRGDPQSCILASVNFGRDTDCLAAVAGGLAGAFAGARGLPKEWLATVNRATRRDPYTNNRRSVEQTADGLLRALRRRMRRIAAHARRIGFSI